MAPRPLKLGDEVVDTSTRRKLAVEAVSSCGQYVKTSGRWGHRHVLVTAEQWATARRAAARQRAQLMRGVCTCGHYPAKHRLVSGRPGACTATATPAGDGRAPSSTPCPCVRYESPAMRARRQGLDSPP